MRWRNPYQNSRYSLPHLIVILHRISAKTALSRGGKNGMRCIMITVPIIKLIPPEFILGKTYYADTDGNILNAKGHKLAPRLSPFARHYKKGSCYPQVRIAEKNFLIHKLVCAAFWGLPKPGQVCHHFDGNKFNNRPDNLIWLDPKEHPLFDRAVRQGIIYKHVDGFARMDYEISHHCEY